MSESDNAILTGRAIEGGGDPFVFAGAGVPSGAGTIQLVYLNDFDGIWEYRDAIAAGDVDVRAVVGVACPVCGRAECWREIAPYERGVIEVFPYEEGRVLVARGQCRRTGRTFSLLPTQLIPYYRYTMSSVVGALLLAWVAVREEGGGFGRVLERDARFVPESRLTAWLLETWLDALLTGLRRAHPVLARWAPLGAIASARGRGHGARLAEVGAYLGALGVRGPPVHARGLGRLVARYGRETGRFLVGTPSQART